MQRVLILAYFYPPCELTAGARPSSWVKHLHEFGYHPVVLTRKWESSIKTPIDLARPTSAGESIQSTPDSTIIRLPYSGSLRDRIYVAHGDARFRRTRRSLSFAELLLQNFFIRPVPFRNLYFRARDLLRQQKDIGKVIITANPFACFHFGHALRRDFPHIRWIADYRDDWTTSELLGAPSPLQRVLRHLDARSEERWVGSASMVTTVSDHYRRKLEARWRLDTRLLENGFADEDVPKATSSQRADEFVVTYAGTLYPTQRIELFLEAFTRVAVRHGGRLTFRLNFPGLAYDSSQVARVRAAMRGHEDLLHITERISRADVLAMQSQSHAFLMVSHTGVKGVPSSKLYDYLMYRRPVFLCPDDGDVIHAILKDTALGLVCNSANEVDTALDSLVCRHLEGGLGPAGDAERIARYSRRNQTRELARLLDGL